MSLINPSWLLPAIPVLVGSLTLMGLFVKHHQVTGKWMARCWSTAWKKLFTKAAFFWFVNLVFMAVSVLHAGLFFALLEPANAFFGLAPLLGFAVAMTLDLASIVFMQARLSALRMNEKRSAGWYLCFRQPGHEPRGLPAGKLEPRGQPDSARCSLAGRGLPGAHHPHQHRRRQGA